MTARRVVHLLLLWPSSEDVQEDSVHPLAYFFIASCSFSRDQEPFREKSIITTMNRVIEIDSSRTEDKMHKKEDSTHVAQLGRGVKHHFKRQIPLQIKHRTTATPNIYGWTPHIPAYGRRQPQPTRGNKPPQPR